MFYNNYKWSVTFKIVKHYIVHITYTILFINSTSLLKSKKKIIKCNILSTGKFVFCLFRATPAAYGGSQARGQIGAVAVGLHHSHHNTRSKLCL